MQGVHRRTAEKHRDIDCYDCETDHRKYRIQPNGSCMENAGSAERQACKEYEHDQ